MKSVRASELACICLKKGSIIENIFSRRKNWKSNIPIFIERNKGYNTLQFYTCDISPVIGSNSFVGGLQDNGTLLFLNGELDIDDMISGGDGAFCFFDENESILITSTYYNAWYCINLETKES